MTHETSGLSNGLRYIVPMALLLAIPAAYLAVARHSRTLTFPRGVRWLRVAAVLPLVVSGIAHFTATAAFAAIVPPAFPEPRMLVLISGVAELAGAAGLLYPSTWPSTRPSTTRRMAALGLVLLMIAVFPANVYVAGETVHGLRMPGIPARTAMQAAYILLLLVCGWGVPSALRHTRVHDDR